MDVVIQAEVSTVNLHSDTVQVKTGVGICLEPVLLSSAWVSTKSIFMLGATVRAPGLIFI